MRKRDRERMARRMRAIVEDVMEGGVNQLEGAAWYAAADAEGKAMSFSMAAYTFLQRASDELVQIIYENEVKTWKKYRVRVPSLNQFKKQLMG